MTNFKKLKHVNYFFKKSDATTFDDPDANESKMCRRHAVWCLLLGF